MLYFLFKSKYFPTNISFKKNNKNLNTENGGDKMCELFGVCSKDCIPINNYLHQFYKHCEQHPHGWGLALMRENQSLIEKEAIKASESKELEKLLEKPIIVNHAFAHIRLATMGCQNSFNCHPFSRSDNTGRTWTLIHNGTVFKCGLLNQYMSQQIGQTDSERILLHIIDEINEKQEQKSLLLNENELFNIIDNIISKLAKGNKLNLLLFNEDVVYAHSNYKNSLYYLNEDDKVFIATTPLSDEAWKEFPINRVISFKNGQLCKKGKVHNNEYEISQEDFEFIFEHVSPELKNTLLKSCGELNNAKECQCPYYKSGS